MQIIQDTNRQGQRPGKARAMNKRRYFKSIYGATASIRIHRDGTATLTVFCGGKRYRKIYNTEHGARIALGKWSDEWTENKGD